MNCFPTGGGLISVDNSGGLVRLSRHQGRFSTAQSGGYDNEVDSLSLADFRDLGKAPFGLDS